VKPAKEAIQFLDSKRFAKTDWVLVAHSLSNTHGLRTSGHSKHILQDKRVRSEQRHVEFVQLIFYLNFCWQLADKNANNLYLKYSRSIFIIKSIMSCWSLVHRSRLEQTDDSDVAVEVDLHKLSCEQLMQFPPTFPALPDPGPPTHNTQQAYHIISETFNNSLELL
jgi:hypothetical protein